MLRLTGGELRGRMIQTPAGDRTRPTQSRLRQALFNSLQSSIPDANVLDVFAGSGALGFEALSRGARSVTFVESGRQAARLIEKNASDLRVKDRVRIIAEPIEKAWAQVARFAPYDIALLDPPYEEGWEPRIVGEFPWSEILSESGIVCLEWGIQKSKVTEVPDRTRFLVKVREKTYGDSILTTYSRTSESETGA